MDLLSNAKAQAHKAQALGACVEGEGVFFVPGPRALKPGHIYSIPGLSEYRISGMCEYHFDYFFGDPEEE